MSKEEKVTVEAPNKSVFQLFEDWRNFVRTPDKHSKDYGLPDEEDISEDIKPMVMKIRAELEARGIDPSTVYPVSVGDFASDDKPLNLTMTFKYENYEGKA